MNQQQQQRKVASLRKDDRKKTSFAVQFYGRKYFISTQPITPFSTTSIEQLRPVAPARIHRTINNIFLRTSHPEAAGK